MLFMQEHTGGKPFRRLRKHRRWTRVQAIGVAQRYRFGQQRLAFSRQRFVRGLRISLQAQQWLTAVHHTRFRYQPGKRLAADHHYQRQQAAGIQCEKIGVEFDQRLTNVNLLALLDQTGKALAREVHRVEANVHQHLQAIFPGDGDRMPAGLHIADNPGHWRAQGA